ncbi:MAG: RDD family protein [Sphingomonadales bacterium]|jgi:uncharacterized RDD family membrane protein YckC
MANFMNAPMRDIVTPEGAPLGVRLADRGTRAVALALDLFFIFLSILALLLLTLLYYIAFKIEGGSIGIIVLFLGLFFLRSCYFIYFELKWNGRTPGKKICGIRVIDRLGRPLEAKAIIARNLLRELEIFIPMGLLMGGASTASGAAQTLFLLIWSGIFLFLPFFNKDRLRAGDMVAGTLVIEAPKTVLDRDIAQSNMAQHYVFTPQQLDAYGIHELQVLEGALRKSDEKTLQDIAFRIARKIEWGSEIKDHRAFLNAYYAQLRGLLEGKMRFGVRRKDKHDRRV